MLIARAPLRISLGGGGTDLPAYYEQFGGMVVSTTIDKYVYVHIDRNGAGDAQITSADYQTFYRHHLGSPLEWEGDLSLPRAVLHEFGLDREIALFIASEVPPGTGLGSSSAVAVALVRAVATYLGRSLTRQEIAELACEVELKKLRAPIGKQDQFAAAFGGLNAITFEADGVTVERVRTTPETLERLEKQLMLFFTGTARNSTTILREQQRASAHRQPRTIESLHHIKEAGLACRRCLESGDVEGIGALLDEGWQEKRRLTAGITSPEIDESYEIARKSGAIGGKITGAGGGGFLLLFCPEARQEAVTSALERRNLRRMDFHLERRGVDVTGIQWAGEEGRPTFPGEVLSPSRINGRVGERDLSRQPDDRRLAG
jgi:D-glycero-alpha-D-manno-heptose-7-phosphate kinase